MFTSTACMVKLAQTTIGTKTPIPNTKLHALEKKLKLNEK